jgi:hypothetical protein
MPIVLDGTNGVTAPNVFGRNIIINGSGTINQRGYVSGAATSSPNQYTLDRWRVVTSGQNLTFSGTNASRTMTAPAGGVEQVVEDVNVVGGTYVLNWTGTATATVDGTPRAKGATFTLTANTNVTVRFTSGTFSEVQLERGSAATPYEHRPFGAELALCQRYYWRSTTASGYPVIWGNSSGNGAIIFGWVALPVQMRATPTVNTYGTWTVTGPATTNPPSTQGPSPQGFMILTSCNAAGQAGLQPNAAGNYVDAAIEL